MYNKYIELNKTGLLIRIGESSTIKHCFKKCFLLSKMVLHKCWSMAELEYALVGYTSVN